MKKKLSLYFTSEMKKAKSEKKLPLYFASMKKTVIRACHRETIERIN